MYECSTDAVKAVVSCPSRASLPNNHTSTICNPCPALSRYNLRRPTSSRALLSQLRRSVDDHGLLRSIVRSGEATRGLTVRGQRRDHIVTDCRHLKGAGTTVGLASYTSGLAFRAVASNGAQHDLLTRT